MSSRSRDPAIRSSVLVGPSPNLREQWNVRWRCRMKPQLLRVAVLSLLLMTACGGNQAMKFPPIGSCIPSSKPEFAYVLNNGGISVSTYGIDSCTGNLTPTTPPSIPTGANSFGAEGLAVDLSGRFAYVANLMSNATDLATISMFTINPSTGILTPTTPATVPTGFFPQGIAIDPAGKFVYTANSDDNTVSMFTVNQSTGVLTSTTPPTVPAGLSPGFVTVDPSGRFAYVSNSDGTISMYTINSTSGVLTPTTPATVSGGSFGVTVAPSGKFAYVPDPDLNYVFQFSIDPVTGVLSPNTPNGIEAGNNPAWVAIDPSSKFAYVTNRSDNTVSMFIINPASGNLTPNTPAAIGTGTQPWPIAVEPSGKFLYVGNEGSPNVSIYTLNTDGTLTAAGQAASTISTFSLALTGTKQ
jgi:6-phosphogluconolactonase